MPDDRPEAVGPELPAAVRLAFTGLGILAALVLAVVVVFYISLGVQQHGYQQDAQRNRAAATTEASAEAAAFFGSLRASADTAPLTAAKVRALGKREGVITRPPVTHDGSVVVSFEAARGYVEPGSFEGGQGTVGLCYIATMPMAPATVPGATLRQTACLANES